GGGVDPHEDRQRFVLAFLCRPPDVDKEAILLAYGFRAAIAHLEAGVSEHECLAPNAPGHHLVRWLPATIEQRWGRVGYALEEENAVLHLALNRAGVDGDDGAARL